MCEPSVRLMLHTGRTAQIRGGAGFDSRGPHPQWLFLILQKYFLCGWSLLFPPGTRQSRQPLIFSLYRLFSSLIPKNPYFFGAQGQPWFCADLEPIYDSFCAPVVLRRAMTSDSRCTSNAFLSQLVTEIFF